MRDRSYMLLFRQESILKYPDIFCGSPEHTLMQVFGSLLIALASTFLVGCCYAAVKAPGWSGTSTLGHTLGRQLGSISSGTV